MNTARTNLEPQQQNSQVGPAEETPSRTAAHMASIAGTITSQISGSLEDRSSKAQKIASKSRFDQRAAKDLATKKRKKMAHRRRLRASHTKG